MYYQIFNRPKPKGWHREFTFGGHWANFNQMTPEASTNQTKEDNSV